VELREKKQKRCTVEERTEAGDMWDHTAIAADSKLMVSLVVGKRTQAQTKTLVHDDLLRCALTVEERAVGLIQISAAKAALELAPGLTTGMAMGAEVAAAEPAPVGTTEGGANVRVDVDRARAASGEGDHGGR
jgi:hypothetical protein